MSKTTLWHVGIEYVEEYDRPVILVSKAPIDDRYPIVKIRTISPKAAARKFVKEMLPYQHYAAYHEFYSPWCTAKDEPYSDASFKACKKEERKIYYLQEGAGAYGLSSCDAKVEIDLAVCRSYIAGC